MSKYSSPTPCSQAPSRRIFAFMCGNPSPRSSGTGFLRRAVSLLPNPQAGGPPVVSCPPLLIEYIIFVSVLHIWRPSSSATWGISIPWWPTWYGLLFISYFLVVFKDAMSNSGITRCILNYESGMWLIGWRKKRSEQPMSLLKLDKGTTDHYMAVLAQWTTLCYTQAEGIDKVH
jgi:hypothetical protein